jgi:hypothetical protein
VASTPLEIKGVRHDCTTRNSLRSILTLASSANAKAAEGASAEIARPDIPPSTLDTRRHLGVFVRPDLGFGYFRASGSADGVDASISGSAASAGIAVGGALFENSILAFHIWDIVLTNPTYSSGGTTTGKIDATFTLIAFGPEYTTYTADNLYFSVTPSLTRGTVSSQGSSSDTDWGFGLRATLGKEWWVSDHWGLGIAGHVSLSLNRLPGTDAPTWTGWGATIAFSATYN